jgi:hypothetical protein
MGIGQLELRTAIVPQHFARTVIPVEYRNRDRKSTLPLLLLGATFERD